MTEKKYLVSGATGFLGKFIIAELASKPFDTIGRGHTNTIKFDLSQTETPLKIATKYDFLIIASGHAHVFEINAKEMHLHHNINFKGTQKLVESVDINALKGVVYISSVAVYGENQTKKFREDDELLGESPYARSKVAAEKYLIEFSKNNNVPVLILRVPLIVGKCPPGNLGAMIEAIQNKKYFSIANGKARRSMVLADDLAKYIIDNCGKSGIYNLSDGIHPSFRELEIVISKQLGVPPPKEIPFFIAMIAARVGDILSFLPINSVRLKKLMNDLIVDDSKAREETNWKPKSVTKYLLIR